MLYVEKVCDDVYAPKGFAAVLDDEPPETNLPPPLLSTKLPPLPVVVVPLLLLVLDAVALGVEDDTIDDLPADAVCCSSSSRAVVGCVQ